MLSGEFFDALDREDEENRINEIVKEEPFIVMQVLAKAYTATETSYT